MKNRKTIATRIKGDTWELVDDLPGVTYPTLTDTLEAYFQKTGYKGDYIVSPSTSMLYIITEAKPEKPKPVKKFNIYGD